MTHLEERDPRDARRELRIERAVTALVLHGYLGDTIGFNTAATDLGLVEHATLTETLTSLHWALARLPRSMDDPTQLRDHLATLYAVPDDVD